MPVDEHVLDLIPLYALGCLDEAEIVAVAEHLSYCEQCSTEWQAYQAVADNLALAAPDAAPGPHLHQQLLDRISPAPVAAPPPDWRQAFAGFWRQPSPAWSLTLVLVVIGLLAGNFWLWRQVNQIDNAEFRTIAMIGAEAAPDASGLIIMSADGEYGSLVVDHLPPLGADQVYQLWLIFDGERSSGALFSVSDEGYGVVEISATRLLSDFTGFGVTIEPVGGSPGPTGARVLGAIIN
jgi:anti-sigma-K factor RskA